MFHVKQLAKYLINRSAHETLFYMFLFCLPFQTRILYFPDQAYVSWYFNYHLAFFVYFTDLLLVTCFVSWLVFDKSKREIVEKPLFWLIIGFFITVLASLLHVKQVGFGIYETFKWFEVLLLVIYVWQTVRRETQFKIAALTIFVSGTIQSIIGVLQFHMQHDVHLGFLGEYVAPVGTWGLATIQTSGGKLVRAYGTMPHPNILGAFLVLALICALYLWFTLRVARFRMFVACGTLVVILGIFTTFSRISWTTAMIIVLCFMFYMLTHKQNKLFWGLALVGLVACGTIGILWHSSLNARVADSTITNNRSINDRFYFDKLGLALVKQHPLLGVGVGNYVPALEKQNHLEDWQYQPAHNIFIFIAGELGLVGLALFISIIVYILLAAWETKKDFLTLTILAAGIIFIIMGQLDHYFVTIQQGRLMFFALLGLLAAVPNLYDQKPD